jgi:ankyrin repeat protein
LGYEYEKLVPAYLSLKLLEDSSIKNFTLNVNPSGYRKFDDLTVNITTHEGPNERFLLQLKHRQLGRDQIEARSELNREKKNFNISDYCAEFERLSPEVQDNYKFILYTNAKFRNFHEVRNYKAELCRTSFKAKVFNTDNIYQFQESKADLQKTFYRKFYLYSGQKNVQQLIEAIVQIFRGNFHSDSNTATCYIDFFGNLRMGNYLNTEITRDEIILKLTSLLLSNHVIRTRVREERNNKIQQLEEAIQQFEVTLLQDIDQEFVKDNWCYSHRQEHLVEDWARNNKMLPKQSQDILDEKQKQLLQYLMQNLVFVNVVTNYEDVVYKVVNLCRSTENFKLKFVLTGKVIEDEVLKKWKIFRNLSELRSNQYLYHSMTTSFKISLQGRKAESVETFKTEFDLHFDEFITPDILFKMLQADLVVGTAIEKLSGYYIPRILLKSEFNYKHLEEMCEQNTVIVQCNGESKTFRNLLNKEFRGLNILDLNHYQQDPSQYQKSYLVLTDQKFYEDNHSTIQLKLIQNNKLEWIKMKIEAEDLNVLDKQIKAICGSPGIGKTTMMKRLANKCPLNYWVVIVPLQQHNWFLKTKPTTEEILKYFLNSNKKIDQQVLQYFQKFKQILFLFDGLDELDSDSITNVLGLLKQINEEGYKVWIFCTTYLKKTLRNELEIYSIYEVEDLKKKDLKEYVSQHLKEKGMETTNIELITYKLFHDNIEEIDTNIVKVPLFLFIVSEIVSGYKNFDNLEEILTLTRMYSHFIERRLEHNLNKTEFKYPEKSNIIIDVFKHYYYREYKIAALKSCLNPSLLELLKIENDKYFLKLIEEYGDILGLMIKINKDETFAFSHHTYAEFFAALWLTENYEVFPLENRKFIFEEKYDRIRNFFNIKLAEGCPLHQAILRLDVSEVERLAPDHFEQLDSGGRTPLHIASLLGRKYPVLKDIEVSNNQNQCESSMKHQKILECLLNVKNIDPLRKDRLFQWNCFEYADASLSLLALENLSKKQQFKLKYLTNYHDLNILCNYCVSFGYGNILSTLIKLQGSSNLGKVNNKPLLNVAVENGHKDIVQLLVDNDTDLTKTCPEGRTPLHEAVLWGHFDLVRIFLDANLHANKKDYKGNTALQLAAKMGHFDVVKLLVERGAMVNTTDDIGQTPLHKTAYMANRNIVEYLIANGADPNTQDIERETVLQQAVQMGQFEVVQCLIQNGADINAFDRSKRTALHYAAFEGYQNIVEYLVANGIEVAAADDDGKTALQLAIERKHENVVRYLKDLKIIIQR